MVGLSSHGREQGCDRWWRRPDVFAADVMDCEDALPTETYRFGRSLLTIRCGESSFSERFREVFTECACDLTESEGIPCLNLRVSCARRDPGVLVVSTVPCLLNGVAFVKQLFPERQYLDCLGLVPCWQTLAPAEAPHEPVLAFGPSTMLVSSSHPWQRMVALWAVSNTLRLQPDIFVFHAASVGLEGKGVLLFGEKGAGKTTLSLCLASRGHAFLGDEWGAVSASTGELFPIRRAASIRPGPRPKEVDDYVGKHTCVTEILPDGTERVRARVGAIFPSAAAQVVPLTHAFFLRRFGTRPSLKEFAVSSGELPPISPLLATMSGYSPGQRAFELLQTLGRARWWQVDVGGSPEETVVLIEKAVKEDLWD